MRRVRTCVFSKFSVSGRLVSSELVKASLQPLKMDKLQISRRRKNQQFMVIMSYKLFYFYPWKMVL